MPDPDAGGDIAAPELKALDAWWTVLLVDPLAVRLVRAVERFAAVTPTRLTVLAHLMGLVSAVAFMAGWLVLAAVVFEVRFVIDCADGKLARRRGTSSAAGAYLDYVGDYLVVGANLVALSLHLTWGDHVPLLIGVALPAAFLAHIAAGQGWMAEAVTAGVVGRKPVPRLPSRYVTWMEQRRLRPLPSRIDAEHALLFVGPLLAAAGAPAVLAFVAWVSAGYFAYRALRITGGGYRVARSKDDQTAC